MVTSATMDDGYEPLRDAGKQDETWVYTTLLGEDVDFTKLSVRQLFEQLSEAITKIRRTWPIGQVHGLAECLRAAAKARVLRDKKRSEWSWYKTTHNFFLGMSACTLALLDLNKPVPGIPCKNTSNDKDWGLSCCQRLNVHAPQGASRGALLELRTLCYLRLESLARSLTSVCGGRDIASTYEGTFLEAASLMRDIVDLDRRITSDTAIKTDRAMVSCTFSTRNTFEGLVDENEEVEDTNNTHEQQNDEESLPCSSILMSDSASIELADYNFQLLMFLDQVEYFLVCIGSALLQESTGEARFIVAELVRKELAAFVDTAAFTQPQLFRLGPPQPSRPSTLWHVFEDALYCVTNMSRPPYPTFLDEMKALEDVHGLCTDSPAIAIRRHNPHQKDPVLLNCSKFMCALNIQILWYSRAMQQKKCESRSHDSLQTSIQDSHARLHQYMSYRRVLVKQAEADASADIVVPPTLDPWTLGLVLANVIVAVFAAMCEAVQTESIQALAWLFHGALNQGVIEHNAMWHQVIKTLGPILFEGAEPSTRSQFQDLEATYILWKDPDRASRLSEIVSRRTEKIRQTFMPTHMEGVKDTIDYAGLSRQLQAIIPSRDPLIKASLDWTQVLVERFDALPDVLALIDLAREAKAHRQLQKSLKNHTPNTELVVSIVGNPKWQRSWRQVVTCKTCGKADPRYACPCRLVRYCSPGCQKANRSAHRRDCDAVKKGLPGWYSIPGKIAVWPDDPVCDSKKSVLALNTESSGCCNKNVIS